MSSPISLELQSKIALWRQRAATGELTLDEMKEAIIHLRAGRVAAAAASSATAAKRKKAFATIPSQDDLLNELEGL